MNNSPFSSPNRRLAVADSKYRTARFNLLLIVIFTVINIVLAAANAGIYLLFSASVPYVIAEVGIVAYYYPEQFAELGEDAGDPVTWLIVCVAIGLVLTVPYFLCWVFSKNHHGWMIAALVLFSIDTVFLFLSFDTSMIIDLFFHAYVMYYLIMGVVNGARARKEKAKADGKPTEEAAYIVYEGAPAEEQTADDATEGADNAADTLPLRSAAVDGQKIKVYIELTTEDGHRVQYRRVGRSTDELVIDGYVYAEMPARALSYMTARLGGVVYEAGVASSRNIITVNGTVAAENVRWI